MATAYDPTIFGYQNFYSALLTADITSGSLTIAVDTVPSATSGILVVDPDSATNREVIFYTSKGVSNIVCPSDGRGWAGTSAVAHLTGTTVIMADVAQYFSGLSDGTLSSDPLRTTLFFDHIVSGGVVAQSAGLVGTFSNIIFYLAGRRYSGTSIANKTYTASKDTYVDITGNSDGTVTVTYTEVANNAASPALATNNIRVAIVTTSGAAITNVNQGQETQVIPIASGVAYSVTDSIGNLICPRDPLRKVLGLRQTIADFTTASGTAVQVTGLTVPVIIPANRKIKITISAYRMFQVTANTGVEVSLWDGTVSSGTQLHAISGTSAVASAQLPVAFTWEGTPSTTSKTYNLGLRIAGGSSGTLSAAATFPTQVLVELI